MFKRLSLLSLNLSLSLLFTACGSLLKADPNEMPQPNAVLKPDFDSLDSNLDSNSQKSKQLKQSGLGIVGQAMPFFSGWEIGANRGRAYSLKKAKEANKKRYAFTICASWCAPCMKGLERLSQAKTRFLSSNTELIILVADTTLFAQKLYNDLEFDWAHVVVDEFKTFAFKLAPTTENAKKESLSLPRTFVFNPHGIITHIISIEGEDYIDLLIGDHQE